MTTSIGPKTSLKKGIQRKRDEISLAEVSLTTESYLAPGQTLPLIIQPAMNGVNLASWAATHRP